MTTPSPLWQDIQVFNQMKYREARERYRKEHPPMPYERFDKPA